MILSFINYEVKLELKPMSQFPVDDQKYGTLIIDKKNVLNMIRLSFK